MSRNISTTMQNHLNGDSLTLCTCVRLIRKDGLVLGFTTLDVPITFNHPIDGIGPVTYTPFHSVEPTSVRSTAGTSVDNGEMSGVNDDYGVSKTDLIAGRYDDTTEILQFKLNYVDILANGKSATSGPITQFRGYIGEITLEDITYKIETLAQLGRAQRVTGNVTQPTCRIRRFCNAQCKLDPSAYTFSGLTPPAAQSAWSLNLAIGIDTHSNDFYTYGIVKCTFGANIGIEREIKQHTNSGNYAVLVLKEAFPFVITTGDIFSAIAGCDRSFGTCSGTYNNAVNFRGEPHLPGNSALIKVGRVPVGH